ncbi:MAG: Flagellar FliJ related protein [Betaproteobacteria bacterium]|jgi:flagellar FliJ protein|nr:Flagellar FliJ related protein [Betaproteobacteria bacterium]
MKSTFRLKVVQDLAQKQSDSAATRLGLLNAEAAKAEQKLNMLLEYREDYRARFRGTMNQDVHSAGWMNFQQFLVKLDEAVDQQRAAWEATRQAVLRGQSEWQSKQIQVKAYDTLALRHQSAQADRVKKFDQFVTDEFAARSRNAKG